MNLQPPEFSARYKEQFFDRLWLHGLGYAGVLYAVGLAIYFCAAGWVGYQARGVEDEVAKISSSYTNAIQLKARLGVLQERSQLKYAALDCWQTVAEKLPSEVTLQRSSFVGGQKLSLGGVVNESDTQKLIDFYKELRKAEQNGQPMFSSAQDAGDQLQFRKQGDKDSWSFSLVLLHTETQ